LPGEPHGWRSLVDYSPWVPKTRTRLSDFTFTLIQYDWYSSEKRKDTETDRGKRYVTMETGITLFTRQVMPTIDSNHQKPGERRETDSPSEPLEGTTLADTLTSDFWPPALR